MFTIREVREAKYTCNKCGRSEVVPYSGVGKYKREQFHDVYLERPGYGSTFDGMDIQFDLCDECLRELLDSFVFPINESAPHKLEVH